MQKSSRMTYGCQQYDINRLCRFDRRAIDRGCDGCPRTTDKDYLTVQDLWVAGVSHQMPPPEPHVVESAK